MGHALGLIIQVVDMEETVAAEAPVSKEKNKGNRMINVVNKRDGFIITSAGSEGRDDKRRL